MKEIVAFGGNGMVGSRVVGLLGDDFNFSTPSEREIDITDKKALEDYLSKLSPHNVVNFAAITDVNYCETERENKKGKVWRVNALAPGIISELSYKYDFFFVQISTDMVFPGNKEDPGPYEERHFIGEYDDLTWYGASKAEGEKGLDTDKNAIVRIIYPVSTPFPDKLNYAEKILKMYDEGRLYPMFVDQHLNVSYVDELAVALKIIFDKRLNGVYHVASRDLTTPYEFAEYLLKKARKVENVVEKGSFEEFVKGRDKRRYPQFGGLEVDDTQKTLGINFSSWRGIVDELASGL